MLCLLACLRIVPWNRDRDEFIQGKPELEGLLSLRVYGSGQTGQAAI